MTQALPHFDEDDRRQSNWEEILRRLIDTGGQSIGVRFGVGADSWPGGSDTTSGVAVAHGLGKTPVVVFTQSTTITAHARPTALTSTTFNGNLRTIDGTAPGAGAASFYWLAIG
jgi:hypothetical protein